MSDRPPTVRIFLKCLVFALVVPGTVVGYVPLFVLLRPSAGVRIHATVPDVIAIVVGSAAIALLLWCVFDFGRTGGGTPAPIDPPRRLVIRGPYRYTRNPMYISVAVILLCEALILRSRAIAIYALLVWLGFHLFIVLVEEPGLRHRFGDEYDRYCERVPRWWVRWKSVTNDKMKND